MRKNVASQYVAFQAVSTTDGSAVTTGTPAVYYTIDAGSQGTGSGSCVHEGNGCWSYACAQAETNGNHVVFTFVLTGAVSQSVNVYPVGYDETAANLPAAVNSIANDAITAASIQAAAIDFATFAADCKTGTGLKANVESISANAITAAAINDGAIDAATFAAGAINAAAIANGAIDIATFAADCLTGGFLKANVESITAGAITATAIATGAIDADSLAADAGTEIGTAVWATAARTLTAATNITSTGGTTVPQTGDSYARLGAPAGASIAADLVAIDNFVDDLEGRLTATRAGYLDNLSSAPPAASAIADAVWDEASTGHTDAGKAGAQVWTDIDAILDDTDLIDDGTSGLAKIATDVAAILVDTGTTLDTLIKDVPTVAEFEARSIVSADYFVVTDYTAPPAASAIADAVWDEALVAHDTAGTAGLALAAASTGSVDYAALASAVWKDTTAGDFTTAGSIGKSLAPATLGTVPGAAGGLVIAGTNAPITFTGSGNAFNVISTGANGNGFYASGNGTGSGSYSVGGATGHGVVGVGGSTSGMGITARADGDGSGLEVIGAANGHGLDMTGAGTGSDFYLASSTATLLTDIAAVTTKLDTTWVLDGAVYQFTANALELAAGGTGATPAEVNAQVLDVLNVDTLIDGKTIVEALKIIGATTAGKMSGAGTGTEIFVGLNGTTVRVTGTVDSLGNRTGATYS